MFNSILFVGAVLFFLAAVILMYKFFGKTGLYVFTAFGTLLANIQVCKCVDFFGFSTTAGNVLYAATFLVTDILSEKYGKKSAQKAVGIGLAVTVLWIVGTQGTLRLIPNANDTIDPALQQVFGLVPRVALSSLIGYAVSQSIDVALYHLIWKKSGGNTRFLWLRNNGSTCISQLADTVVFTTLAFWGTYPLSVFVSILVTTYLFKVIVAVFDTPFIYLARKVRPVDEK
jgi:hypothetical protein